MATCLGLGWMPVAPGTWGSLPPAVVFGVLAYCGAPSAATVTIMALMVAVGCVACVVGSPASITATGREDPSEVVSDEFAGQAVAFLAVPLMGVRGLGAWESVAVAAGGFLAFRVIDIFKPGPIKRLERLPAGWGILADDLAAGAVAGVLVCIAMAILARG